MDLKTAIAYINNVREYEDLELGSVRQLGEVEKFMKAQDVAIKGAIAALSQNATFPADIEAAKKWLEKVTI
jgi:hypothetical protein